MTEHNHSHNHDHDHAHDHETTETPEYITLVDEEGNERLYEILFTFDSEDFNKSYVVLYPAGTSENDDEDEEVELQAFAYIEDEGGHSGNLEPIETDEEWDMVEEVLNTFLNQNDDSDEAALDAEEE